MKLFISLPVHEKPDVVIDQLRNFERYCPQARFVIHISRGATDDMAPLEAYAAEFPDRIRINPTRLQTRWGDILNVHVSNLQLICEVADPDDKVAFHSSNDLLVRAGAGDYAASNPCAFHCQLHRRDGPGEVAAALRADPVATRLFDRHGLDAFHWSQIEGSFYPVPIIAQVVPDLIEFGREPGRRDYITEEIIIPTLAAAALRSAGTTQIAIPYIFSEMAIEDKIEKVIERYVMPRLARRAAYRLVKQTGLSRIRPAIVKKIRAQRTRAIEFYNNPDGLYYDGRHIYGVKRVPRVYGNELRTFIRGLD